MSNGVPARSSLPAAYQPDAPGPEMDAKRASIAKPSMPGLKAPTGAPNVVIVLLDDMGFGGPSAFGGPCEMPTADRLAGTGLRYTRFHVNAMCSPTRQSLMTGRNHHAVGMGATTEMATSAPGYTAIRPDSAATMAQLLRMNGYSTGAFGKMHQTPMWEVSAVGPFDRWPTGEGFERFYGFVGPEMNHWDPLLFEGTTPIQAKQPGDSSYHLSEDLADRAIEWVNAQQTLSPDRPFFLYLAMGACHSPLHVPEQWRDRYKGKFAHGWTAQRELTLAKQKSAGLVPPEAQLAPWVGGVPDWAELSSDEKLVAEAFMETYAAVAEHVDAQVGRVVGALEDLQVFDDTLFIYILGDNGASAEGGIDGTLNAERIYSGVGDPTPFLVERLHELGGPHSYPLHPAGWSLAMSTPYQWTKQVASHFGGTRDGMIVNWPNGITESGGLRHQWHHVIDVLPTILEVAGIPAPSTVNGVSQQRIDGVSMCYSFSDGQQPDRRTTQYFETFGNRAIYHEGWIAATKHRTPWEHTEVALCDFEEDVWELYDLREDWTQSNNIAEQHPDKLAELKRLFLLEAARNAVFPLDDRSSERMNPSIANRPDLPGDRTTMVLRPPMTRLGEEAVLNLKNRSHRIDATVTIGAEQENGVLVAQGGRFGGWALHLVDSVPIYTYNYLGLDVTEVAASAPLRPGTHRVSVIFEYLGPGRGGAATLRMEPGGNPPVQGALTRSTPYMFSSHETLDLEVDLGTPVSPRYDSRTSRLTAELVEVRLSLLDVADPELASDTRRVIAHQ